MSRILCVIFIALMFVHEAMSIEPVTLNLWPENTLELKNLTTEERPAIILYQATGVNVSDAAVVICPGGGYNHLAIDKEGSEVAEWFNAQGMTALVLKYRVGTKDGTKNLFPIPFLDAQRAVRLVRARAAEWKIAPEKIGIMGFSAGGHLASTVGTHFEAGNPEAADIVERQSSRPDFMILIYPVISFKTKYAHRGSLKSLLGENADEKMINYLSNETQVSPKTPPTFLIHTSEDPSVPAENSVLFYLALRDAGVPAEMHIYERGPHGFGMHTENRVVDSWIDRLQDWLIMRGLIEN